MHALHKSASMFLYELMFRLSREKGIRMFSANHPEPDDHLLAGHDLSDQSFCLGPQRDFRREPEGFPESIEIRRIFQLRDPRDILVSQYYSFGWSHTENHFDEDAREIREQIQRMTIDEYVLDESHALRRMRNHLKPLLRVPPEEADVVVHYEQMVTDFKGWLSRFIIPFRFKRFGVRSQRIITARYAFRYRNEFRPDTRPNSHKRSVLPGDHQRRLKPGTIIKLNEELEEFLQRFGYLDSTRSRLA